MSGTTKTLKHKVNEAATQERIMLARKIGWCRKNDEQNCQD